MSEQNRKRNEIIKIPGCILQRNSFQISIGNWENIVKQYNYCKNLIFEITHDMNKTIHIRIVICQEQIYEITKSFKKNLMNLKKNVQ